MVTKAPLEIHKKELAEHKEATTQSFETQQQHPKTRANHRLVREGSCGLVQHLFNQFGGIDTYIFCD